MYTFVAYYGLPTTFIAIIYIYVYYRVKRSTVQAFERSGMQRQQNRDLKIFRNLIILFGIYLSGGAPTAIFIFTHIEIFYSIGIVFISLTVVVEKSATFYVDRELLHVFKRRIRQTTTRVIPTIT
ncbi:unnamed protein product [Rotaria sp. Silwood1]|nr:unnamed protein product [Rotaria sp. Silwood1]CAF1643111.1 unnamed protein product [Rotaria sp. Silwood1]CAF3840243.1 unnamed protein product [Rotaria sp. Silwood1]CAF5025590.1 unnamed protein product [Rotaria sp. Silwood1]